MTASFPLPVETLESVRLFEDEYEKFCTWRDSLPVEEQIELAFYGARVLGYAAQDTQPLPVIKVPVAASSVESAKQIAPPAASPAVNKQQRKKEVK